MSDIAQGPGWWLASDLKWYPPELHPDRAGDPSPAGEEYPENIRLDTGPSPLVGGDKKRISRPIKITSIAAGIAVAVVVVLVAVLPGAAGASGFLGGSGTATVTIDAGSSAPIFSGAFGKESFSGSVNGDSNGESANDQLPQPSITGTLDGTAFSLKASFNVASFDPSSGGSSTSIPSSFEFNVTGRFGSMPVHATLTWQLPTSLNSNADRIQMSLHGTVGVHTLEATGSVSGNSSDHLVGTFQYTVN
jgi:hypothetical protein